jgi:hypothetical protein
VSRTVAWLAGAACELAARFGRPGEPAMTRFLALQLSTSHSYDPGALERDHGYEERVSTAEATERLVDALRTG